MKADFLRHLRAMALSRYYYMRLRRPKRWGLIPAEEDKAAEALRDLGVPVENFVISPGEYKDYFDKAGYADRYPQYYRDNIAEKSLEHFIAQRLLEIAPSDIYIDIASQGSPVPEIYHRLYGCTAYAQDLSYPPGVHGDRIGSDAAAMPLPDGAVTKMALHCSFEHFEGDADSGFIKEAARVLRVGGKMAIVPFYLATTYGTLTDLRASRADRAIFDPEALVIAVNDWGNRHGRFYDPPHFISRVLAQTEDLAFRVLRVANSAEIDKRAHAHFALVATRV